MIYFLLLLVLSPYTNTSCQADLISNFPNYRWSLTNNGSTYDISTLQWCKNDTHSVGILTQILNFYLILGQPYLITILSCEAGQWCQTSASGQPYNHEGQQPIPYGVLCYRPFLDIVFSVFASHHVYKTHIHVSCFRWEEE